MQSVKYKDVPVSCAEAGQTASFWLQLRTELDADAHLGAPPKPHKMRRGMVLREHGALAAPPTAHWEFEGAVDAVRLPTPISAGSEIVCYCNGVKQAARVLRVDDVSSSAAAAVSAVGGGGGRLEEGARARLRLRFLYAAESLLDGAMFIFRESSGGSERLGVGVGVVTTLLLA